MRKGYDDDNDNGSNGAEKLMMFVVNGAERIWGYAGDASTSRISSP